MVGRKNHQKDFVEIVCEENSPRRCVCYADTSFAGFGRDQSWYCIRADTDYSYDTTDDEIEAMNKS